MAARLYKDRFQTGDDDGWVTSKKSTSVSRRSHTTELPSGQRQMYEIETTTATDGGLTSSRTTEKRSSIGDNKWIRSPAAKIVTRSKTEMLPSMKLSSVDFIDGTDARKRGALDDMNMREGTSMRQSRVHEKFAKMSEQASAPVSFGATFDAKRMVREAADGPSAQDLASASAVQQELQQFTKKHMQQDIQQAGYGATYGAPDQQKSSMKVTLTSVKTVDTPDHRVQQITTTTSNDGQVTQQQRVARYGKKVMPDIPPPSNALGGVSYGVTTQQQVRGPPPQPQATSGGVSYGVTAQQQIRTQPPQPQAQPQATSGGFSYGVTAQQQVRTQPPQPQPQPQVTSGITGTYGVTAQHQVRTQPPQPQPQPQATSGITYGVTTQQQFRRPPPQPQAQSQATSGVLYGVTAQQQVRVPPPQPQPQATSGVTYGVTAQQQVRAQPPQPQSQPQATSGVLYGVTAQQQVRAQPPPPQPQVMSPQPNLQPWQQTQQIRQVTHVFAPSQPVQPPVQPWQQQTPPPMTQPPRPFPVSPPVPQAGQPPLPPWQQQPPRQAPVSPPQVVGQPSIPPWQQPQTQAPRPGPAPGPGIKIRAKGSDLSWVRASSPDEGPSAVSTGAHEEIDTSVRATKQAFSMAPPSGPMAMGATYTSDMIKPKKPRGQRPPQPAMTPQSPAPEVSMAPSASTTQVSFQHQRQIEQEERLKQQEEQKNQQRVEQLRRLRMQQQQQQQPQGQRQVHVVTMQQQQGVQIQPRQPQPPSPQQMSPSPQQMPPSPAGQAPPAQLPPWQQPKGSPVRPPAPPPHVLPPHIRGPVPPPPQWQQGPPPPPPPQPPAPAPPGVPRGFRPVNPPGAPSAAPVQQMRPPAGGDVRPPWVQGAAQPPSSMMTVQPAQGQPRFSPQTPPAAPGPQRQPGPSPMSPPAPAVHPARPPQPVVIQQAPQPAPAQPREPPAPLSTPQPAPQPAGYRRVAAPAAPAAPAPEAAPKPTMVVLKPGMKAAPQPQPKPQPKPELKKVEPGKLGASKHLFSGGGDQAAPLSFGASYTSSDVKTAKPDKSRWQPKTKPLPREQQPAQTYTPELVPSAATTVTIRSADQPASRPAPQPPAPKPDPKPTTKPAPASPVIPQAALKQKGDVGWIKRAPVTEQVTLKKTSKFERHEDKGGLESVSLRPLSKDEKEIGAIKKGVSQSLASRFQTSEGAPVSFGATFTPGSKKATSKQESKVIRRQEKTTFDGGQVKRDIKVTETDRSVTDAGVKETTKTTTTTKFQASPSTAVQEKSKTEVQVKTSAVSPRSRDQTAQIDTITTGVVSPVVLDIDEAQRSSTKVVLSPSPKVTADLAHPLEQATSTRKILKVTTRHGELEESPATPTTPSTPKSPQTPPLTPQQQKKKLEMEQRRAARSQARAKAGGVSQTSQEVKTETILVQEAPSVQVSGSEVKQESVQIQQSATSAQQSQEVRQQVVAVQEIPSAQPEQQQKSEMTSSSQVKVQETQIVDPGSMQVIQEQVVIKPAAEGSAGGQVSVQGQTVQVHQDQVKVLGQETGGTADFQIQVAKDVSGGQASQIQSGQAGFEIKFQADGSSGSGGEGVQVVSTSGGGQMHVHREVTTTVDGKTTTNVQDKTFKIDPGAMTMDQGARVISADDFFSAGKSAMAEFAEAASSTVQIQEPKSSEQIESHQTIEIEAEPEETSYETNEQNESFTISI